MLTSFSVESRLQRKMDRLGITADFLSVLAGIPASRLSQAFRGIRALDNAQGSVLERLIDSLEELANRAAPLPLSFKNPAAIKEVLKKVDDGYLRIAVVETAAPIEMNQ